MISLIVCNFYYLPLGLSGW